MKQIKENAITNQKKIIAELKDSISESSREIAIAKLNLMVDDYEKDNNVIDAENIHLFYEFMSDEDLYKYADILDDILQEHLLIISEELNISSDILLDNSKIQTLEFQDEDKYLKISIFNNRVELQTIDEYIKEIKDSNDYKKYRLNRSSAESNSSNNFSPGRRPVKVIWISPSGSCP